MASKKDVTSSFTTEEGVIHVGGIDALVRLTLDQVRTDARRGLKTGMFVSGYRGSPVLVGSTAAILGHPLRSLVAAARFAAEAEEPLKPGWLVMAGGASHAEALKPGLYVECEVQNLGRCSFSVVE